jgi:hypothetical protein
VQSDEGLAEFKSEADISKRGTVRDAPKTGTIAVFHVEDQSDKRHFTHFAPIS